jgi:hypothetical protein
MAQPDHGVHFVVSAPCVSVGFALEPAQPPSVTARMADRLLSNNGANVIRQTATLGDASRQAGCASRVPSTSTDSHRPGAEAIHGSRGIQLVP